MLSAFRFVTHVARTRKGTFTTRSNSEFSDYTWILYKKFLFMVHPDFFSGSGHAKEKEVNSKSVKALSRIVEAVVDDPTFDIKQSKYSATRTLIFYVKGQM